MYFTRTLAQNTSLPEDKIGYVKGSFWEGLECVFYKLPKYHMKILLEVNAKVGRKDISKPTIWNEILH
jgi:hypothetical protein